MSDQQDLIEVNLSRDLTIRSDDGGVETYGPGVTKVPPRVAYTLALRPEYIATDGTGVPLRETIEQLAQFGSRHVDSMPSPDKAYAAGREFAHEPITRAELDGKPTGADRQGGRLNAVASDSPALDSETQHFPLPGQREHSPAQRAQLAQDVRRADIERDSIARDQGQNPKDLDLRISEQAQRDAQEHEERTSSDDASGAFTRFAGDSETHESSEPHGGAYQTEGGDAIDTQANKSSAPRKRATKRSGSKRSASKRSGAKRSASKRGATKRASTTTDEE